MHENDAAKMFDLAAIKLRGRNTKLNFPYEEYLDEQGQVRSCMVQQQQQHGGAAAGAAGLAYSM
jgi:hypothetical protein